VKVDSRSELCTLCVKMVVQSYCFVSLGIKVVLQSVFGVLFALN
jgi:hypothetical protein